MQKIKKVPDNGDIFMIPLYLPSNQKWRNTYDEFIDYRKYKFHTDDIYAFGRFIELYSTCHLIEIFSYVGDIPDNPEIIISSGRMFFPMIVSGGFDKGRWRVVFEDVGYDKWKDSDYDNISFLYHDRLIPRIWKGGKDIHISKEQFDEARKSGNPPTLGIEGAVSVEDRIRSTLTQQGKELNYEKTVEKRKSEYPQPKDMDKKLKERLLPFKWMSYNGKYVLTLDVAAYNGEYFTKHNMQGNGYDWEKLAALYLDEKMPNDKKKIFFDCEADMFSVHSGLKKVLKEFAISFHEFCLDGVAFENMLMKIKKLND